MRFFVFCVFFFIHCIGRKHLRYIYKEREGREFPLSCTSLSFYIQRIYLYHAYSFLKGIKQYTASLGASKILCKAELFSLIRIFSQEIPVRTFSLEKVPFIYSLILHVDWISGICKLNYFQ